MATMKKTSLSWRVGRHPARSATPTAWMPATVPGAVQLDWAHAEEWPPYWQGENFRAYDGLEDFYWTYEARLEFLDLAEDERLFFVCGGVDYHSEVVLNGKVLLEQEGMYAPLEVELTGARNGDTLQVIVHPAPKSRPAPPDRDQANSSCKPAVSYGWDFHPRLIPLGIWQETGLEIRQASHLRTVVLDYALTDDFSSATLSLQVALSQPIKGGLRWTLLSPLGEIVFIEEQPTGPDQTFHLQSSVAKPQLWWPHDQGDPALHILRVELLDASGNTLDSHEQRVGFRRVRLVMAPDQWKWPNVFPLTRSHPPITLEINGRSIFAKGANWVSPEIFPGLLARETYVTQLNLAKSAHMNLLRLWGGAPAQKKAFYDLCDELGLMIWQEFPLACNFYADTPAYLRVLDSESRALIAKLKPHPSLVLWCGGNELFNHWSRMTDQSLALRLLGSNCYQLDPARPFLPTSPVGGMAHGHYIFRDPKTGEESWSMFQRSHNTAYCEFGSASPASIEVLREIIPESELFPPKPVGSWLAHHAFGVWQPTSHLYLDVQEYYFGPPENLEQLVERGQLLQSEGYKGLYEEARRQKPVASMALCWCLNEPWPTAANNNLIAWPSRPKPALAAVGASCRPLLASARIRKFVWNEGEIFDPELWWLNDAPHAIPPGKMEARLETADGQRYPLLTWEAPPLEANTNQAGPHLRWKIPNLGNERFDLVLSTPDQPEAESRYTLLFRAAQRAETATTTVMNTVVV